MAIKLGDYEVVIKKGDKEFETLPEDLPVYDFEGNLVTYKEGKEGYMRTADYTQKTQKVAEVNKFLTEELGFQDPNAGVATMRRVLETMHELGDRGILDLTTGEIKMPEGKPNNQSGDGSGDGSGEFTLSMDQLPPEVRDSFKSMKELQRDMGQLMGYISRREITEKFPEMPEGDIEMVHKLAAIDPSRSPMEHAENFWKRLEERGQAAVDAYVEESKKPKDDGHVRPGSGDNEGFEMFTEDTVFSNMPDEHDGKKVVTPSEAANAYLEAVFNRQKGE